jgi:hypothetical protein
MLLHVMFIKSGLTNGVAPGPRLPLRDAPCQCLADFFRQELTKHYACLERQREYYSDVAITQAEDAVDRLMAQIETLCQREDACQMIGELLKKLDSVTKLSAWTDPGQLH